MSVSFHSSRLSRVFSFVLVAAVAACGSHDAEERPPPIEDPLQFDATPETRAQLGIERWGLSTATPDEMFVHGYDGHHRMTLELHQKVGFGGPGERRIESDLAGEHGAASMKISVLTRDADEGAGLETWTIVEENTFETNEQARRTLERVRADADAAVPAFVEGAAPQGASLVKSRAIGGLDPRNGASLVEQCAREKQETCTKEDGVKLIKKDCAKLVADCQTEVIAAEKAVLAQNAACAHKATSTSWRSRLWCQSVSSSSSCALDNAAVEECDTAVAEASAKARASGTCQVKRLESANCADPGSTWDRYEADLARSTECDRQIQSTKDSFDKCVNDCLSYMDGQSTETFKVGGNPKDYAGMSFDEMAATCEKTCASERDRLSNGQPLDDDCKSKR